MVYMYKKYDKYIKMSFYFTLFSIIIFFYALSYLTFSMIFYIILAYIVFMMIYNYYYP